MHSQKQALTDAVYMLLHKSFSREILPIYSPNCNGFLTVITVTPGHETRWASVGGRNATYIEPPDHGNSLGTYCEQVIHTYSQSINQAHFACLYKGNIF